MRPSMLVLLLLVSPGLAAPVPRDAFASRHLNKQQPVRAAVAAPFGSIPLPAAQTSRHQPDRKRTLHRILDAAGASGVLLDWRTGKTLAVAGKELPAAPGSVLKPFFLAYALQHGLVTPDTSVYCRRSLEVAGRSLSCTHPAGQPMLDAEAALALSCNTWFAMLAKRMRPDDVRSALHLAGLQVSEPHLENADVRVLTVLGLRGVQTTPAQIAAAYRALLLHASHTGPVWKGLRGSATYGMASNARRNGIELLGKTGTASDPGQWWTHGWFAGGLPDRFFLVVYVPHGDGGTAAALAGQVLRQLVPEDVQ